MSPDERDPEDRHLGGPGEDGSLVLACAVVLAGIVGLGAWTLGVAHRPAHVRAAEHRAVREQREAAARRDAWREEERRRDRAGAQVIEALRTHDGSRQ